MLKDLMTETRSVRNFDRSRPISESEVLSLIGLCTLTPSAANLQAIKFTYTVSEEGCTAIFPHIKWAGYFTSNKPPFSGNEPTAYILLCNDTSIRKAPYDIDTGIYAYAITLGAREIGLGSCMIGSFSKEAVSGLFGLGEGYQPLLLIALGAPKEKIQLVTAEDTEIKYYRNKDGVHCVPKRSIRELIITGEIKK
ncbi:MAG: nitroreductase family protein [Oscillospiraceae bacterium]|nr:nitroreductase family protein [Oscillospiraceae bacterium]